MAARDRSGALPVPIPDDLRELTFTPDVFRADWKIFLRAFLPELPELDREELRAYLMDNRFSTPMSLKPVTATFLAEYGSAFVPPLSAGRAIHISSLADHLRDHVAKEEMSRAGLPSDLRPRAAAWAFAEIAMVFRQHANTDIPALIAGSIGVAADQQDTPQNRIQAMGPHSETDLQALRRVSVIR